MLSFLKRRRPAFPARDVWGVGLVKAPIDRFLTGWPAAAPPLWLTDSSTEVDADPFVARIGERIVLMTEHVPRPGRRGEIVAREVGDGGRLSAPRPVIRLPVHASYPFVLDHGGSQYCIPETYQANGVLLFRAAGPQPAWIFERRLIDGFAAVDSTIVRHQGRLWLFCTRYGVTVPAPANSELHLWFADDLAGPWRPHPGNPVKVDVSNARPAGTPFVHGGALYRPAQDCSRTYGGAVNVNRVVTLTESAFREEIVSVIAPLKDSPFPDGIHHISACGGLTFIDGKRIVFDALARDERTPQPGDLEALRRLLGEAAG